MVTLGVTYLDNSLNTKLTPETVIVKNYLEIILNSLCHHFYVNRCGFYIVEFYNSHHPDPNDPDSQETLDEQDGQFPEGRLAHFTKVRALFFLENHIISIF